MRLYLTLICSFVLIIIQVSGEIIDTSDFDYLTDTIYSFSANVSGETGRLDISLSNDSTVEFGSVRSNSKFHSESGESDFEATSFSDNRGVLKRHLERFGGPVVLDYSDPWLLAPRYLEIGENYESRASYSYESGGSIFQGSIHSIGGPRSVEEIEVPAGKFEAVASQYLIKTTETVGPLWATITEAYWIWSVRGVGTVKYGSSSKRKNSKGEKSESWSIYELEEVDQNIYPLSVFPSRDWYDGWLYLTGSSWVYNNSTFDWIYFHDEAIAYDTSGQTFTNLAVADRKGWHYMEYPYLYLPEENTWIYIYGDNWIYDFRVADWVLMEERSRLGQ